MQVGENYVRVKCSHVQGLKMLNKSTEGEPSSNWVPLLQGHVTFGLGVVFCTQTQPSDSTQPLYLYVHTMTHFNLNLLI